MDEYTRLRMQLHQKAKTSIQNTAKFEVWTIHYGSSTSSIRRQLATKEQAEEMKEFCLSLGFKVYSVQQEKAVQRPKQLFWKNRETFQKYRTLEGISKERYHKFDPIFM